MTPNAFTVDVEDYFQVSALDNAVSCDQWPDQDSRVVASTRKLLELLDRHQTRGTFFILGWTAERYPDLVREIHQAGHEIGSHSYWHRLVYELTPDEFRDDLRRSRDVLQDIIGEPVTAYRAPSFSIVKKSIWAKEILVEEGFQTDSSIVPVLHDRYGFPESQRAIHWVKTAAGPLLEFPPSICQLLGLKWPVGGGGYFRLYPYWLSELFLRWARRATDQPFMFYTHPWEVDPEQPVIDTGSRFSNFRHHVNLKSTLKKLDKLLSRFDFAPMRDVLQRYRQEDGAGESLAEIRETAELVRN